MSQRSRARWRAPHPGPRPLAVNWDLFAGRGRTGPFHVGRVSCLCVTRGCYRHLERAVRCFEAQTYADRELVVVFEELEEDAHLLLEPLGPRMVLVRAPTLQKLPLGTLRNLAVSASSGDYVCGWDDDDWHSPQRIEVQLRELADTQSDACLLQRWLVLDAPSGRAYVSGYRAWEGSLLCRRRLAVLEQGYPPLAKGEDRELVKQLVRLHRVSYLDRPELYVYVFHGANTWDAAHFEAIFRAGYELSPDDSERLRQALSVSADW